MPGGGRDGCGSTAPPPSPPSLHLGGPSFGEERLTGSGLKRSRGAMSWDSYVNDHMVTTGMVSGATIAGADGTVWAENWGGTKYAGTDMKEAIVALWNGFGQPMPSGIKIGGDKFMYIRGDEDSMYFKKGAAGLYVMKGATFIALGFHDDSIQPPQCTGTVAKICEYLISQNM